MCVWRVAFKHPPWKTMRLVVGIHNPERWVSGSVRMWRWLDQSFWLWTDPTFRPSALSRVLLARGYQYTPTEEEWAAVSSPGPWSRPWEGALETALSCPVSSCPHAATVALGASPPVGTCVAPVLHQNSGWWGLGQQVQKHPKAASPFSSNRFLSWPWNGFRSFLDQ